tara:strand:- start:967 stop:1308 length:342 start_codon:yes stop_codon:yes gene_type:complete
MSSQELREKEKRNIKAQEMTKNVNNRLLHITAESEAKAEKKEKKLVIMERRDLQFRYLINPNNEISSDKCKRMLKWLLENENNVLDTFVEIEKRCDHQDSREDSAQTGDKSST